MVEYYIYLSMYNCTMYMYVSYNDVKMWKKIMSEYLHNFQICFNRL